MGESSASARVEQGYRPYHETEVKTLRENTTTRRVVRRSHFSGGAKRGLRATRIISGVQRRDTNTYWWFLSLLWLYGAWNQKYHLYFERERVPLIGESKKLTSRKRSVLNAFRLRFTTVGRGNHHDLAYVFFDLARVRSVTGTGDEVMSLQGAPFCV